MWFVVSLDFPFTKLIYLLYLFLNLYVIKIIKNLSAVFSFAILFSSSFTSNKGPKVLNSWICQSTKVYELNYFTHHGLWCNDKKAAKWQVRCWHCFLLFVPPVPD